MRVTKIYILGISLFIILSSCQFKVKAKFEIRNNSNLKIDSLSIDPNQNIRGKFISLNPGETKIYWTDMSDIPKGDGDYLLTYNLNKGKRIEKFGYYTNGYPAEKSTTIIIKPDSVKFDFEYSKY